MKYLYQFGIIGAVSLAGELLRAVLPFPVPASVYGLVLMLAFLCTGIIKLSWIEETADYLLLIMPVLFIEPSVKLMTSFDLLKGSVLPFVATCLVSWAVVLIVTGRVMQAVIRGHKKQKQNKGNMKYCKGNMKYCKGNEKYSEGKEKRCEDNRKCGEGNKKQCEGKIHG